MRKSWVAGLISMCAPLVVACVAEPDDASKYREPLPAQGSVALALPRSGGSSTGTRTRDIGSTGSPSVTSSAEYYAFSRTLTDAIDGNTAAILGAIWAVAQTPPTKIESNKATWGPGQGTALDPVVWRLVVTEVATGEYDYVLEGRPKASSSDTDFRAVLDGRGYGASHALHDSGSFMAHNETFRALDATRAKDRGTTKVIYDVRQFPKSIGVEVRPNDGTGEWDAKVEHLAHGAGVLSVGAHADIEDDTRKDGKLETVKLKSQWTTTGAGRADIALSGGSLPIASVGIVECWDTSFARAFYKDTVTYRPTVGVEAACPTF